jgi:hypothetical protein
MSFEIRLVLLLEKRVLRGNPRSGGLRCLGGGTEGTYDQESEKGGIAHSLKD